MPGALKIYFNGCSQVENGHLELETDHWKNKSWPWLITESLNAESRNDAISLGSNNRLLRTTIDGILEYQPDIVILGITDANRIELPITNGDRCRINVHHCNTDNGSTKEQFQKYWYTKHHNNWLSFVDTVQILYQIKLLQQAHGFRLYVFNAVCNNHFEDWGVLLPDSFFVKHNRALWRINQEKSTVKRLLQEVQELNWILPWDYNLYNLCLDNKWSTDEYGHPDLASQKLVANEFLSRINYEP